MEKGKKGLTEDEVALAHAIKPYIENGELDDDDSDGVFLFTRERGKTKEMLEFLLENENLTGDEIMEKLCQLILE